MYLPFDGETGTAALALAACRRGIRVYVPIVIDKRHGRLGFYPLRAETRRGAFGIRIPRRRGIAIASRWFDLIVVPLVGIDTAGYRLGMGGGFYDRALAFRRRRSTWKGPQVVGLAFDGQRTDTVYPEPSDVRLDSLATESGLHHFKTSIE